MVRALVKAALSAELCCADINLFRVEKGGDPDIVRKSQAARFDRVEDVDDVIALDLEWRKGEIALESLWVHQLTVPPRTALQAAEKQRGAGGKIQKQIGEFKKVPQHHCPFRALSVARTQKKEEPPADLMAEKAASDALKLEVRTCMPCPAACDCVVNAVFQLEEVMNVAAKKRDALLGTIGNLVGPDVPVNDNEVCCNIRPELCEAGW